MYRLPEYSFLMQRLREETAPETQGVPLEYQLITARIQLQLRRTAASFCAAISWSWQPAAAAPPITASASFPGGRGSIAAGGSSFVAG